MFCFHAKRLCVACVGALLADFIARSRYMGWERSEMQVEEGWFCVFGQTLCVRRDAFSINGTFSHVLSLIPQGAINQKARPPRPELFRHLNASIASCRTTIYSGDERVNTMTKSILSIVYRIHDVLPNQPCVFIHVTSRAREYSRLEGSRTLPYPKCHTA